MSRPIIPQRMKNHKLKFWKSINLWDFIIIILFLGASIGLYFSLGVIPNIFLKLFLSLVLFVTLSTFILPIDRQGKRVYQLIAEAIRFKSSTKKFEFNKNIQTSNLMIPYHKIHDQQTIKTFKLENKEEYLQAFKIVGFDIFNLSDDKQEQKMRLLKELFVNVESNISLIKIDEPLNLNEYKVELKQQIKKTKIDKNLNQKQKDARINQLNEILNLFGVGKELDPNQPEKCFYFVFYNSKFNRLKEDIQLAMNKARMVGLKIKHLKNYELVNLLKDVIEPSNFQFSARKINQKKNKENLDKLLALKNLTFHPQYFKTNPKFYRGVSVVIKYPLAPSRAWLFGLMDTEATVVMKITTPKSATFEKQLNKTIQNIKTNLLNIPEKEATKRAKLEEELLTYESLVDEVGKGEEKFKKINTFYILSANSQKELKTKQKEHTSYLQQEGITLNHLTFQQQEGLSGMIPKSYDPLAKKFEHDTTGTTLAEAFPYISRTIKEPGGIYLGHNSIGDKVIFDQYKNLKNTDPTRKNANMVIMGQAGSGKTVTVTTIIAQHLAMGRKGFIIDPENEYREICQDFNGKWIDVGTGNLGRINPLQIMATLDLDDKDNVEEFNKKTLEEKNQELRKAMISNQISFIESFFKILYPENTDEENRYIAKMVACLYEEKGIVNKDLKKIKPEDWPTIDDLIKLFESQLKEGKYLPKRIHYKMMSLLKDEFTNYGKLANLYNGVSTLKTSDNGLVVFDISTLFDSKNNSVIQAQMMLITAFIQNELRNNWQNSQDEIFILIDEAHLLIDKKYPVALDFVWQMSKRIRKRRGGIILVTQNPDDFVSTEDLQAKTKAIINNSQYLLVMSLSSENLLAVDKMFSEFGGLTPAQVEFLSFADKGQGLLFTSNQERQNITVRPSAKVQSKFIENKLLKED